MAEALKSAVLAQELPALLLAQLRKQAEDAAAKGLKLSRATIRAHRAHEACDEDGADPQ